MASVTRKLSIPALELGQVQTEQVEGPKNIIMGLNSPLSGSLSYSCFSSWVKMVSKSNWGFSYSSLARKRWEGGKEEEGEKAGLGEKGKGGEERGKKGPLKRSTENRFY